MKKSELIRLVREAVIEAITLPEGGENEAFGADYKTEPYNYTRSGPRDKAKTEAITSPEGKAARKAEKDLRTAARGQSTRSDNVYKGKGIDRFDKAKKHWKNWDKLGDRSVAAGKKADSEESRTGHARWKANMAEQARQSVKKYINELDELDQNESITRDIQNAHGAHRDALIKRQAAFQKGYHPDFPEDSPKHPEHKSAIANLKVNRNMAEQARLRESVTNDVFERISKKLLKS